MPGGGGPALSFEFAQYHSGALRVRQQVRALQDGLVTQVCDVWDAAGTLVVHATQLAVVAGTVSGAADGRDATSR